MHAFCRALLCTVTIGMSGFRLHGCDPLFVNCHTPIHIPAHIPTHMPTHILRLQVYKGLWKGSIVAVKTIVLPAAMSGQEKREKMAIMEAAISSALSHPNIMQVGCGL